MQIEPGEEPADAVVQSGETTADPRMTVNESADYLNCSKSYLDKLRVYGGGPTFVRLGKRKILYCKSDLDAWTASRRYTSTSEYRD